MNLKLIAPVVFTSLLGFLVVNLLRMAIDHGLVPSPSRSRFSVISDELRFDDSTDLVVIVEDPDTFQQVDEIRTEILEYRFTLRYKGVRTLSNLDVKLLPSRALIDLYDGSNPFEDIGTGRSSNYNAKLMHIEQGTEIDIVKGFGVFAHESELSGATEMILDRNEIPELLEIARQDITIAIQWDGGEEKIPFPSE